MNYGEYMLELLNSNEKVMVLTCENWGPIVPVGLSNSCRFIDTGINEQTLVGIAAGLALRGRIPFVHGLASFLTMRAYEFIRTDVGIGALPVKLIGSLAGLLSEGNGATHQAIEDLALMRTIPNMQIFCPANVQELIHFLPVVVRSNLPWYIRFNDRPGAKIRECATTCSSTFGSGKDVGLIAIGFLVEEAKLAMRMLSCIGIAATVINLRFLRPLDTRMLFMLAKKLNVIATIEDHLFSCGIGELIASEFYRAHISVPYHRIALETWFRPGEIEPVLKSTGLCATEIVKQVRTLLGK